MTLIQIDSGKFGTNTEVCSNFYEIWHSQQIEETNYEYNIDSVWSARVIIGSEWLEVVRFDSQSEHD